nr:DUF6639 family protein [Actibacterium sp. MT2.3-13A]
MIPILALAVGAALAGALTAPLQAAPLTCPGGEVTVEARDEGRARQVCDQIEEIRPALSACGLRQNGPLTVRLVEASGQTSGPFVGSYTAGSNEILLAEPEALPGILAEDHPFAGLGPPLMFQSLLVHELAHAFLDQAECTRARCVAEHEYVAYAMQLSLLPPEAREALIGGYAAEGPIEIEILNDFIAQADPLFFASRVWLHFTQPENGCGFIARIQSGEVDLRLPPL